MANHWVFISASSFRFLFKNRVRHLRLEFLILLLLFLPIPSGEGEVNVAVASSLFFYSVERERKKGNRRRWWWWKRRHNNNMLSVCESKDGNSQTVCVCVSSFLSPLKRHTHIHVYLPLKNEEWPGLQKGGEKKREREEESHQTVCWEKREREEEIDSPNVWCCCSSHFTFFFLHFISSPIVSLSSFTLSWHASSLRLTNSCCHYIYRVDSFSFSTK